MNPVRRGRRALGGIHRTLTGNPIPDLRSDTERMSSATAESAQHLSNDLEALRRRLARLEDEMAAIRELAGRSG